MTTLNLNIKLKAFLWLMLSFILLPVLFPLAIYVKKNTLRMPAAKGEKSGCFNVNSSKSKNLIFLGESPVIGVGVHRIENGVVASTAKQLSELLNCTVNWQAIGVNGADITYCIDKLLPKLNQLPIDYLVISLGVNDTKNLTRLLVWHEEISRLIDSINHSVECDIYFLATPDMGHFPALPEPLGTIIGYRSRLLNLVTRTHPYSVKQFKFIGSGMAVESSFLAEDGFHPSEKGCEKIGQIISTSITENL